MLLFDLNGFKGYNDAFSHPAGDALLVRLGKCLRNAVGDAGIAYRMGGDEFCVLLGAGASERTVSAAGAALSEHGVGFTITASVGRAALPAEAANAADALTIADQRMYRHKRSARGAAGEQATHALLRVLTERHPDVGDHSEGVADLAFDAMLADLPDSASFEFEAALGELERCAGNQFDPQVVTAFVM